MPSPLSGARSERDISILRAHALAGALVRARPARSAQESYIAWTVCVEHIASVVCTAEGVSIVSFHHLCGVRE